MKKHAYMKPAMTVAEVRQTGFLCLSNTLTGIDGGVLGYGGSGDGIVPRGRELDDIWEDDAIDWQE